MAHLVEAFDMSKAAARPYLEACSDGAMTPFVEYLSLGPDKTLVGVSYTRKAFLKLAYKGAGVLGEYSNVPKKKNRTG